MAFLLPIKHEHDCLQLVQKKVDIRVAWNLFMGGEQKLKINEHGEEKEKSKKEITVSQDVR
jgi:hypothetical protein